MTQESSNKEDYLNGDKVIPGTYKFPGKTFKKVEYPKGVVAAQSQRYEVRRLINQQDNNEKRYLVRQVLLKYNGKEFETWFCDYSVINFCPDGYNYYKDEISAKVAAIEQAGFKSPKVVEITPIHYIRIIDDNQLKEDIEKAKAINPENASTPLKIEAPHTGFEKNNTEYHISLVWGVISSLSVLAIITKKLL